MNKGKTVVKERAQRVEILERKQDWYAFNAYVKVAVKQWPIVEMVISGKDAGLQHGPRPRPPAVLGNPVVNTRSTSAGRGRAAGSRSAAQSTTSLPISSTISEGLATPISGMDDNALTDPPAVTPGGVATDSAAALDDHEYQERLDLWREKVKICLKRQENLAEQSPQFVKFVLERVSRDILNSLDLQQTWKAAVESNDAKEMWSHLAAFCTGNVVKDNDQLLTSLERISMNGTDLAQYIHEFDAIYSFTWFNLYSS